MNPALPPPRALRGKIKVHLPKTEQVDDFDCGPAALWSILRYYGCEIGDYDAFLKECDATKKDGTDPEDLVRVAKKYGLLTKEVHGMTIKHLERVLQEGKPVIINLQAWGQEKYYRKLQSGHYATAIGFDDKRIYFEDPSLHTRKRGSILKKKLLERWRDRKADGEILNHYGIIAWKEQASEEGKAMKQRLNPVLPPPRRPLNPVDALLTARSPQQVRLHFARYRRALLYEWERDPKYKGAKGSKWVGTGDDAGKTPRYQASKPGGGRGKKEPAATGGRGKKEEAAGKSTGGKPSKKEPHADIVQHLRDVLSGEGEEADALFAKLQDRLAGMSPAERKEAAEKLGAVLGGKKPAAKKEPKAKKEWVAPERVKPTDDVHAAVADLYDHATDPATTLEQMKGALQRMKNANAPRSQLDKLASYVGIVRKLASKAEVHKAIERKLLDRKGSYDRATAGPSDEDLVSDDFDAPEPKKTASTQPSEASAFDAMKKAWVELNKENNVKIPELFDEVAAQVPGLTQEQFYGMLKQWKKDDLITLQLIGHRDAEPRGSEALWDTKGSYFYVQMNDDPQHLKLPPGRDKPTPASKQPAEKPAPAKRTPAAAKKKPQKGDVNEKGQVFDGRYWRKPEGAEKPKEKAPAEKKPAAKPGKIADKPTPGKPSGASPEQMGKALKDTMEYLGYFVEHRDGLITMDRIYHELVKKIPDITPEQMQNTLWQLSRDYQVELHVLNEAKDAPAEQKKYAIEHNNRMYNFVRLKDKNADLVPSKPVDARKQFKTRSEYEAEAKQPTV